MPDHETSLEQFGVPRPLIRQPKPKSFMCRECGIFFAVIHPEDGQLIHCPKCEARHKISIDYRLTLVIDHTTVQGLKT